MAAIGTRVYVRAREIGRIDTRDDNGRPVSIVWWRDGKHAVTGKEWLAWYRGNRCLRRVQFAGESGPARIAREWRGALAEIGDRAHTVTGTPLDTPVAAPRTPVAAVEAPFVAVVALSVPVSPHVSEWGVQGA